VLPVFGIPGQRMNLPLQMSGGTSTELLSRGVQQLLADDDVASIVLLVDSRGARATAPASSRRSFAPRVAPSPSSRVRSLCASAAYWIASQADRRDSDEHGRRP
jgi:ClpP class serine protease